MASQNSVAAISNRLEANRQSATLSLAYAAMPDDGVVETSKFVRDNPFVKYLDLRGNNIQAKGAIALANGVKLNRSLRALNLKWNAIGKDPSGVSALCDALKSNLTILQVDFRNNCINHVGAKHIGQLLKDNSTITHFDLSWNDLGLEGGAAILDGLKKNHTLIELQLSGSKVGEDTLTEVAYLLRRNREKAREKAEALAEPEKKPVSPQASTLGLGSTVGSFGFGATASSFRSTRTVKDDSTLMIRILQRERDQLLPEDKLEYTQVVDYIEKLLNQSAQHKQGRADGEERERQSTAGFGDREQRYSDDVRKSEDHLKQCISDRLLLQKDIAGQTFDLKVLNDENAAAIRDSMIFQEKAMAQEQQLRKELRDIMQEKRDLQDKLALGNKDLDLLSQENERLQEFVEQFKTNHTNILS